MTTAATAMSHWSRYQSPIRMSGRQIAKVIATNWIVAFHFPHIDGVTTMPSEAETAPRSPMISSSRPTITNAIQAETWPSATSASSHP